MVKLDKLVRVFALVDAVDKEGRHLNLPVDSGITRDDVVGVIAGEGDARHVGRHSSPASIDGHVDVGDITTRRVE